MKNKLYTQVIFIFLFYISCSVSNAMSCKKATDNEMVSVQITENIKNNSTFALDVAKAKSILKKAGQLKSPVTVTEKMQSFRNEYLPLMQVNTGMSEALVRYMEADLRIKSEALAKKLANQGLRENYDLIIIGAGVHGVVALHSALSKNGSYKILVVESSDTGGSNFRYANEVFNINSSNRASGEGKLPLPGEGNINELPNFPIQVSDKSAVKYPTAGDLGRTIVTGLYSATSKYPNVDVLLNSDVKTLKSREDIEAEVNSPAGQFKVVGSRLAITSGLGTPGLPKGVAEAVKKNKALVKSPNIEKTLPRVITFENFVRLLAKSSDPKSYFANKKISVVGEGDSANVAIEFMLGYAVKEAYGISNAQTPGPKKIFWLGQDARTCEEFIADIRSRYAQIGTGFRNSNPDLEAIIQPIPNRIASVEEAGAKTVNSVLDGTFLGESTVTSDVVILATGYKSGVTKLVQGLLQAKAKKDVKLPPEEFLEKYGEFVMGKTKTSDGALTRVARSININGKASAKKPKVVILGPAAGKLPVENELAGIIQNTVSIFNNAPRTFKGVKILLDKVKPRSKNTKVREFTKRLEPKNDRSLTVFEIKNLSSLRTIPGLNDVYLKSVLANLFSSIEVNKSIKPDNGHFVLNFYNAKGVVVVASNLGNVNLREVIIDPLVATRDFFNTVKDVLSLQSKSMKVSVPIKDEKLDFEHLTIEYGNSNRPADTQNSKSISNNGIDLRGI